MRPWAPGDRKILDRTVGDAAMMAHLGGREDAAALDRRHERYCDLAGRTMYVIELGPDRVAAGTTGCWEKDWHGERIYEAGWMVFPEMRRRGIASAALAQIIEIARAGSRRSLHAFPNVENLASNAVCAKANFTNAGPCEFEYPPGSMMVCNDWYFVLR